MKKIIITCLALSLLFLGTFQATADDFYFIKIHVDNQTASSFSPIAIFPDCKVLDDPAPSALPAYGTLDNHLRCTTIPRGALFLNGRNLYVALYHGDEAKVQGDDCKSLTCHLDPLSIQGRTRILNLVLSNSTHEPERIWYNSPPSLFTVPWWNPTSYETPAPLNTP